MPYLQTKYKSYPVKMAIPFHLVINSLLCEKGKIANLSFGGIMLAIRHHCHNGGWLWHLLEPSGKAIEPTTILSKTSEMVRR